MSIPVKADPQNSAGARFRRAPERSGTRRRLVTTTLRRALVRSCNLLFRRRSDCRRARHRARSWNLAVACTPWRIASRPASDARISPVIFPRLSQVRAWPAATRRTSALGQGEMDVTPMQMADTRPVRLANGGTQSCRARGWWAGLESQGQPALTKPQQPAHAARSWVPLGVSERSLRHCAQTTCSRDRRQLWRRHATGRSARVEGDCGFTRQDHGIGGARRTRGPK